MSTDPSPTGDLTTALPFAALVGIEIVSAAPQRVVGHLDWTPERSTAGGSMHGGAIMSLADTVGGTVAFLNLPDTAIGTSTISSATQFTRALRSGRAVATGHLLHRGRTTIVVETDVVDDQDRLVARVTQTQAILTT